MPEDLAPDRSGAGRRGRSDLAGRGGYPADEPADAGQVLAVYQAGLDTGLASFESTAPGWEAFDAAKLPRAPVRCRRCRR